MQWTKRARCSRNTLATVKVLDPACGSGNFLYVTLQKLKDLEKEAILFGMEYGLGYFPRVGPWQLHGIEINRYAHELAQMTVWIGYLQWIRFNGFEVPADPILKPMDTFRCMDAILDLSDPDHPKEPEWPAVDFIVGNPPFLGDKLMRGVLGDDYVDTLRAHYHGRVPGGADLCCYWFEKGRAQIEATACKRAGLLATQGIRGGLNRTVLERIKRGGDIFFAESDRPWVLDGAAVRVSMVGFDHGDESERVLDGVPASTINSNLSAAVDVTQAAVLAENRGLCFLGVMKAGPFDIDDADAQILLRQPNPHGRPNSDVLRPRVSGKDVSGRSREGWLIDFNELLESDAAKYEAAFEFVRRTVLPTRSSNRDSRMRRLWWLHGRSRPELRRASHDLVRFIVTPEVSKHRVFVWLDEVVLPDHKLHAFPRNDHCFFGILHSRVHEVWSLAQCSWLGVGNDPSYSSTRTFETFPFPWPPGHEPAGDPRVLAIAAAARELNELRERWLNPPEWTREEILEFPGSIDGPWARYVHGPDARGIGTVRWPRRAPRDADCAAKLKARTLTNLYNQRPAWLTNANASLDSAVLSAYDWHLSVSDEALLASLLALNLQRSAD